MPSSPRGSGSTTNLVVLLLILLSFPLILLVDIYTDYPLPVWAIYSIPAVFGARFLGTRAAVLVTMAAVAFSGASAYLSNATPLTSLFGALALSAIAAISIQWASVGRRLSEANAERARLLAESQQRSAELEESRARLLEFFSLVAHDLQSPLATVSGYAQMLSRRDDLAPEQRQAMGRGARAATQQVMRLAEDLLDASRIGAGKFTVTKAPRNVIAICRGAFEQRELTAPDRRLTFAAPAEPLLVDCDADRIAQAVGNLVDNALKYSPQEDEVRVDVRRSRGQVEIAVTDHGIGIPPDDVKRLLQPYSRLRGAAGHRGLGLGLYIVRGIVEAHDGTIGVQSAVGIGSTFTITLPIHHGAPRTPRLATP
jgi:signal transduction histidine kinase